MSDETPSPSPRPAPEGYNSWPAYWQAQGTPWRTEPEIASRGSTRTWTHLLRRGAFAFLRAIPSLLMVGLLTYRGIIAAQHAYIHHLVGHLAIGERVG